MKTNKTMLNTNQPILYRKLFYLILNRTVAKIIQTSNSFTHFLLGEVLNNEGLCFKYLRLKS